jgi:hypothetical protein
MNYKVGDKIIVTNKNLIKDVGEIYTIKYLLSNRWVVVHDFQKGFDFPIAVGEFVLYSDLVGELF